MRQNKLCSTVWNGYDEIIEACKTAWNWLIADPIRTRSIGARTWATVNVKGGWSTKQRMRWSPTGAHRVALVRAAVLDGRFKPPEVILKRHSQTRFLPLLLDGFDLSAAVARLQLDRPFHGSTPNLPRIWTIVDGSRQSDQHFSTPLFKPQARQSSRPPHPAPRVRFPGGSDRHTRRRPRSVRRPDHRDPVALRSSTGSPPACHPHA